MRRRETCFSLRMRGNNDAQSAPPCSKPPSLMGNIGLPGTLVNIPVSLLDVPFCLPFPSCFTPFELKHEIRRPCVMFLIGNNGEN